MINWDQVKQLEEDIGTENFGDVIVMFIDEVDEAIDNLRPSPTLEGEAMSSTMHFLRGSAANLGFKAFSECCAEGEKLAENGASGDVDLVTVVRLYDESKQNFLAEISNHTSYVPN